MTPLIRDIASEIGVHLAAANLKAAGPETLWPQMLAFAALGVTMLSLAALSFQKRLE